MSAVHVDDFCLAAVEDAVVAAVQKWAHKSATTDESIALIAEDVNQHQVQAGYAEIVSWDELYRLRPTI
jgi:hypothetical protein